MDDLLAGVELDGGALSLRRAWSLLFAFAFVMFGGGLLEDDGGGGEDADWWPATLKVLQGKNFPDIEKWEIVNEGNYMMACASLFHQGSIYVAGRDIVSTGPELPDYQFVTALYRFDMKTGFEKLAQFPEVQVTCGEPMNDCGYPGLIALGKRELAMSYYSSHEGSTNIYLARVQL